MCIYTSLLNIEFFCLINVKNNQVKLVPLSRVFNKMSQGLYEKQFFKVEDGFFKYRIMSMIIGF